MKRLLIGIFAALLSVAAFGTTLNPVQLLNPTGSTSGQGIKSNGPSSAPSWSNAFSISGGTVDNTPVGATTPSTGAFTSVTSGVGTFSNAVNLVYSNPNLGINDSSGSGTSSLVLQKSGVTYWTLVNGAANNFGINRYNSGSLVDTPIVINTSTGIVGTTTLTASGSITANTLKANSFARLNYVNTSGQSIPASTLTTITTWTSVNDDNSNFTASTGIFTAPNTGWYLITGQATFNVASGALNNQFQILIVANSVTVGTFTTILDAAANQITVPFSVAVKMTAAQTALVRAFQTSSGAQTLNTGTAANVLSIIELP